MGQEMDQSEHLGLRDELISSTDFAFVLLLLLLPSREILSQYDRLFISYSLALGGEETTSTSILDDVPWLSLKEVSWNQNTERNLNKLDLYCKEYLLSNRYKILQNT